MPSFHEVQLPPNISPGVQWGPAWSTTVIVTGAGFEQRNQMWSRSRRVGRIALELRTAVEAAALVDFFEGRAGRTFGFRYKDWSDYSVTDEVIAHNEAIQVQLTKTYSSGGIDRVRNIYKPVAGSVTLEVNGSPYTTFALDTTSGTVWLAAALAANDVLTWSGEFDVPVRFDTDLMEMVQQAPDWRDWTGIPIVELREAPTPTLPQILDTFTRADTIIPHSLGTTETGQLWNQPGSAEFGISSNQAYLADFASGEQNIAWVDGSVVGRRVEATLFSNASPAFMGVAIRVVNAANFVCAINSGGFFQLFSVTANVFTNLAVGPSIPDPAGDVFAIQAVGNTINGYRNGGLVASGTSSAHASATGYGMLAGATVQRIDGFEVEVL